MPFTIVSENSFTLTPIQSSEVVVSIHPTVTGSISGTIRLTSSSMSFEIPTRARVMTYEEYAEAMLGEVLVSISYQCGPGCQLMKGLSGLRSTEVRDPDKLNLPMVALIYFTASSKQVSLMTLFDRPWTLIGITMGADRQPFDPSKHGNFFLVERITGIAGSSNITVVARGDHCSFCSASYGPSDIIYWIEQALYVLNQQIAEQDRGIICVHQPLCTRN